MSTTQLINLIESTTHAFRTFQIAETQVLNILQPLSNGRPRNGDIVAFYGEILVHELFGGIKQQNNNPFSIVANQNSTEFRIKVTTRVGNNIGWDESGKFLTNAGMTHVAFVHLNDDYSVDRIWLYQIDFIINRQIEKGDNKIAFRIDEQNDANLLVFPNIGSVWQSLNI